MDNSIPPVLRPAACSEFAPPYKIIPLVDRTSMLAAAGYFLKKN